MNPQPTPKPHELVAATFDALNAKIERLERENQQLQRKLADIITTNNEEIEANQMLRGGLEDLKQKLEQANKQIESDKYNREMWVNVVKGHAEVCRKLEQAEYMLGVLERAGTSAMPCGHNSQYGFTPDGVGKVILCSLCQLETAKSNARKWKQSCREALDREDGIKEHYQMLLQQAEAKMAEMRDALDETVKRLSTVPINYCKPQLCEGDFKRWEKALSTARELGVIE